jgi:hypothetical protein
MSSPSTASSVKATAGMWPCTAWSISSVGFAILAQHAVPRDDGAHGFAGFLAAMRAARAASRIDQTYQWSLSARAADSDM